LGSVAPTVRSFSADLEPLTLIEKFPAQYPGLLESGAGMAAASSGSRFDILPIACGESLKLGPDGRLSGPYAGAQGFLTALEHWWTELRVPEMGAPLPFTGGWLLYLGYELASEIEPRLRLPPSTDPVVALAVRAPAAWIRDRATGQAWLVAEPGFETLLDEFEHRVRGLHELLGAGGAAFRVEEDEPE
jgi:anthranilate synthase component 1